MNIPIIKKWIEALRSGEYKQGKGYLRRDGRFCCLGVLCDLHGKETGRRWDIPIRITTTGYYLNGYQYLPDEVANWAGLSSRYGMYYNGKSLTQINDEDTTFEEIAKMIEENLEREERLNEQGNR